MIKDLIAESFRSIIPIFGLAVLYGIALGYRAEIQRRSELFAAHIVVAVMSALAIHSRGLPRVWSPVPDGTGTLSVAAVLTLLFIAAAIVVWLVRDPKSRLMDAGTLWAASLAGLSAGAMMGRVSTTVAVIFLAVVANLATEEASEDLA